MPEQNKGKDTSLSKEKDSQINVVVNRSGEDDIIDFVCVFKNL